MAESSIPSSSSLPSTTTNTDWAINAASTSINNPDNSEDEEDGNVQHMVNYYFVFIGLAICIVMLAVFVVWRRKQKLNLLFHQSRQRPNSAGGPWEDLNAWERSRANRHSRFGHRRSNEYTREEGLNEHGEAPPPYVPPERRDDREEVMPAVPLRTLSRGQAGLKPPEYRE
jgi:hypothetical protein